MTTRNQQVDRKAILSPLINADYPLSENGGVSVKEADQPLSDLSETYIPDEEKEPINGD